MANILIIDSSFFRNSLQIQLEGLGYEIAVATSSAEGMQKFHKKGFDLVITDIHLADKKGPDVIKRIRQENPQIPIIVMSDSSTPGFEAVRKEGANRVLWKPVRGDQLQAILDEFLGPTSS